MRTFATILDNPGEPLAETRYRDPARLHELGYTDLIIYPTTALSGMLGSHTAGPGDVRRWVEEQYQAVQKNIDAAARAGMEVWLAYDAPTLARELVGSAVTCVNQPGVLCPASDELLDMIGQCAESLVAQFPQVAGLVLRLGDNDAHRLPYLLGNDVYSPHCARCSSLGRADRLVRFITLFHELVVGRLGRRLIVRAWNIKPGGLHDSPELCGRVMDRIPQDDRLILSFKFTHTDFWRYQQWNPSSLVCGDRPVIYELQCQREFEAKGAMPNYQAPLWRDGMSEMSEPKGLAQIAERVNLAGLWAWVRGGGWGGPYVTPETETWIDANVYAVPKLAQNPKADVKELAADWITNRLGCRDAQASEAILYTLLESPQIMLNSFYCGPYARSRVDPWYPSSNFIQDDQIDAEAAWTMIQRLPDAALDQVVAEKQTAERALAECGRRINPLSGRLLKTSLEDLARSIDYSQTLVQTLHNLLAGLAAYRRYRQHPKDTAAVRAAIQRLSLCQNFWNHHQRYASFRGTATAFQSDNLWDLTENLIEQLNAVLPSAQGSGATTPPSADRGRSPNPA